MLQPLTYRKVMLGSAIYDLIFTIPFATPWGFALIVSGLQWIDQVMGLPGEIAAPDALHTLLANLMGSAVLVWAVLRLHLRLDVFGRYDAAIRALFAVWQAYAIWNGVSWVLLVLLALEVVLFILQALPPKLDRAEFAQG